MQRTKLEYAGKDKEGRDTYIIPGIDDVIFVMDKGNLVPGRVIDNGANVIFYDNQKIEFSENFYTFKGLGTKNGYKIKVCELASIPYVGRYGLYVFGELLREASKYMPFEFVDSPEEADIIHMHQVGPIKIPSEWEDKKVILHFHGFKPNNFEEYADSVDALIFISDFQRRVLFGYPGGYVVWNAIMPAEQLPRTDWYNFMFAQSNHDAKNVDWIVDNVAKFKEFLVATAGELNIDGADNYGHLAIEQLHYLHAASLIFVMPSKKEAFGLAPLYAMLQGTAPAISTHSGIAEVLPKDISIHFDPENATLKDIWQEFKEKGLYNKMENIRSYALQYSPELWARKMTDVLLKLTGKI